MKTTVHCLTVAYTETRALVHLPACSAAVSRRPTLDPVTRQRLSGGGRTFSRNGTAISRTEQTARV